MKFVKGKERGRAFPQECNTGDSLFAYRHHMLLLKFYAEKSSTLPDIISSSPRASVTVKWR